MSATSHPPGSATPPASEPLAPEPLASEPTTPERSSLHSRLLVDLRSVRGLVIEAELTEPAGHRYVAAHDAAVRAADLVLQARTGRTLRPGVLDPWLMVQRCAPELGEWADFFGATTVRRRMLEARRAVVSTREADDLVRDAERFCTVVERLLHRDRVRRLRVIDGGAASAGGSA